MKRMLNALDGRCFDGMSALLFPAAAAQTVLHTPGKPKSAQGHKVPMRHDQLTLYPHGRPARRQKAYGASAHRFDQPTPIHNTFMGVQRW